MGTHAEATAAALELETANSAKATEAELKAKMRDPQFALKEAMEKVKDQDGLSNKGTRLVARAGKVAAEYTQQFKKLPLPSSGTNHILEAQASAAIKDTSKSNPVSQAATKNVQTPGTAAVAAAKSTAAGVM